MGQSGSEWVIVDQRLVRVGQGGRVAEWARAGQSGSVRADQSGGSECVIARFSTAHSTSFFSLRYQTRCVCIT